MPLQSPVMGRPKRARKAQPPPHPTARGAGRARIAPRGSGGAGTRSAPAARRRVPRSSFPVPLSTHLVQKLGDIVDAVVHDDPGALAVVVLLHLLQTVVPAPPRLAPGLAGAHHVPHDTKPPTPPAPLPPQQLMAPLPARTPTAARPRAYRRPPPPPPLRPPPPCRSLIGQAERLSKKASSW